MENLVQKILDSKVIAIVRGHSGGEIMQIAEALLAGGVQCMEITYNAANPESDNATANIVKQLNDSYGNSMQIGSGTVLTERQVEMTCAAGGKFIISPNVNPAVIRRTKALGMVSIPGAYSPSECEEAHEAGADFIKLFPAVHLGADYLKAIMAPLPHIKFMVVGGITAENVGEYIKAGAVGVGTGSDLIIKDAVFKGDFARITERAKTYVRAVSH